MSGTLRWGLLSTAHINRRIIPAMRAARRAALVAVASRDPARAREYATQWSIPTAHGSYDTLLRDRTVDAVYISLPNALHVEWTLRAVDAGKHVLCEKPLALTPHDVDRIEAVASARGVVVAEAFMYRHEPLIARIVEIVQSGTIGPVRSINTGFTFAQARAGDVRLEPSLGGGSLWDVGCYAVSAARLVAGTEPVAAAGFATSAPGGVDESFTGVLQFPGGVTAAVHSSFRAAYRTWLDVGGTTGMLRVARPFKPSADEAIEFHRDEEVDTERVAGSSALFVRQVEDFVASALDGRPPTVPLRESRGNAAALVALYTAAQTGRTVTI